MTLDFTKTYTIEPKLAIGDPVGLSKEGLSKYPGTVRTYSVSFNDRTKKFRTGLDEFAPEVMKLPEEKKAEEQAKIIKTRTELEQLIGQTGILDARNEDFWGLWKVTIEVTQDKKLLFMGSHPKFVGNQDWEHTLALITLYVGQDVPFSKKEASDPFFRQAQFLVTTEEEVNTLAKSARLKSRKVGAEMDKLFPQEGGKGDFERAWSVAYLLNVNKEPNISYEKLEETLDIFSKQPEYIDRFLNFCSMENAALEVEMTIRRACEFNIISFRSDGNNSIYYRGGHNFRGTEDETVKYFKVNMADTSIAREYAEIKAAVLKETANRKRKMR